LFTQEFGDILTSGDVRAVTLPARSPHLNAYAGRFVLAIKSECLERLILFGAAPLRRTIGEYVDQYHRECHHQGLANQLIEGADAKGGGAVECRQRLGGLLKYYSRRAA